MQIVVSHYNAGEENSERLMLKYYEYLIKIKEFMKTNYSLDVLLNLNKFPLDTDSTLEEYYRKVTERITQCRSEGKECEYDDRFYIKSIKPFFIDQRVYYEVTFLPINSRGDKSDGIIAFTDLDISAYYATWLYVVVDYIEIFGNKMQIHIITKWETSVRPCEIRNFSSILGADISINSNHAEYVGLMNYLTNTGFNLVEILDFDDQSYIDAKKRILSKTRVSHFFNTLDVVRDILKNHRPGSNVLRYLLLQLNNRVIKDQKYNGENNVLSLLHLKNGCIPFDDMPFCTSLVVHNPKLGDVFECIDSTNRTHELLARHIRNNTEMKGQIYTPVRELVGFDDVDLLVQRYNNLIWYKHTGRKIILRKDYVFIKEYEDDTRYILRSLNSFATNGILNYSDIVDDWMQSGVHVIDSEEKKLILKRMFSDTRVALIYGSAGTGKSTLINHISNLFFNGTKLYLTNTNPAIDNLRRRVTAPNVTYSTIAKFLLSENIDTEYDLLVIDECSTVSNKDMRDIINKADFKFLVLVGDIYQIESIRFGNWFDIARSFIPSSSVFELTDPYRTKNPNLLELWKRVRNMDDTLLEHITKNGYSTRLDETIFEKSETDEIILCLNYSGLYGINNINRFLQQSNPNAPVRWGAHGYRVGDPILFNESDRFRPLIYNNMKGLIVRVQDLDDRIWFDIEIDKKIEASDCHPHGIRYLGDSSDGNSIIRFFVNKNKDSDDDDDSSSTTVPFQIAYAVSIHKAQGLEYDSVKIVITDEIDELVTHNIFYTAITRARDKLKIYWTPEVEKKVLSNISPLKNNRDVSILKTL